MNKNFLFPGNFRKNIFKKVKTKKMVRSRN